MTRTPLAHAPRSRISPAFLLGVCLCPALHAAAFLAAGDLFTSGGWGTTGEAGLFGYAGFPLAAGATAALVGRLAGRAPIESAFWAFSALWAYVSWWVVLVAAYSLVATA